jgi:hypothetical protein
MLPFVQHDTRILYLVPADGARQAATSGGPEWYSSEVQQPWRSQRTTAPPEVQLDVRG